MLDKLINLPFGGNTPFTAEVWYVNKTVKRDLKWGTPSPIPVLDPNLGFPVSVRSFGKWGIRINNVRSFTTQIVGSQSMKDSIASTDEDVIKYGIIPEFMGRFPILVGIDDLTKDELTRILTEPKNNLVAQFKKIFKLDGVELNFTKDAIKEIANQASENKTGARGLRSVLEKSLLKIQFTLPKLRKNAGLQSVEITADFIKSNKEPIMVFKEPKSTGTSKNINE